MMFPFQPNPSRHKPSFEFPPPHLKTFRIVCWILYTTLHPKFHFDRSLPERIYRLLLFYTYCTLDSSEEHYWTAVVNKWKSWRKKEQLKRDIKNTSDKTGATASDLYFFYPPTFFGETPLLTGTRFSNLNIYRYVPKKRVHYEQLNLSPCLIRAYLPHPLPPPAQTRL